MLMGSLLIIFLALLIVAYCFLYESRFFVRRNMVIDLPSETVSENLRDLSNWPQWIPWLIFDPKAKIDYEYSHAGESTILPSCLVWKGKLIKEGYISMEPARAGAHYCHALIEASAFYPTDVHLNIDLTGQGSHTSITVQMTGNIPFLQRWKTFLYLIRASKDIELSLIRLNAHLTQYSQRTDYEYSDPSYTFLEDTKLAHFDAVTRPFVVKNQPMSQKMEQGFHDLIVTLGPQNPPAGPSFTLYTEADPAHHYFAGRMGIPVQNLEPCDIHPERLVLEGDYLQLRYRGSYQHLSLAWHVIHNMMRLQGRRADKKRPGVEVYETGPGQTSRPKDYLTKICLPVK